MPTPETSRYAELLSRIGGDLDRFVTDPKPDPVTTMDVWREALDMPLPQTGLGADAVADLIGGVLIPAGARMSHPGFWGFITAGPATVPVVAATAAMVASPQRYSITAFNQVEELSLQWLAELCGLDPEMKGLYSSGGSTANLVALGAARQWAYERIGVDPSAQGVTGRRGAIYTSTEAHHTIQRSAGVLGIGRSMVRAVPVDDTQRMDVAALETLLDKDRGDGVLPIAVVAAAGTTNTGAIDPLRQIGEVARRHDAWFHVDGAYGLPGILDARIAPRFDGLDLADSAIVDPHKWLAAPVGVAATFVRDRTILHRAFTQEPASYLEGSFAAEGDVSASMDSMGIPYGDFGVELSAPARGVMVWATLLEEGRQGLAERVSRDNDRATRVTDLATAHPRLEALTRPDLSIACVRYVGDGDHRVGDIDMFNNALLRRLVRTTGFLPSATTVNGAFAVRPCFINVRTVDDQVDDLVTAIAEIGDDMASG